MNAVTEENRRGGNFFRVFFYIVVEINQHYYALAVVPQNASPEADDSFVAVKAQQIYQKLSSTEHNGALAKERDRAIKEYQNHNGRGSLLPPPPELTLAYLLAPPPKKSTPSPSKFPDTAKMLRECLGAAKDSIDTGRVYNAVIFDITNLNSISMGFIQRLFQPDSVLTQWPKLIKEYWEKTDPERKLPRDFVQYVPTTDEPPHYRVEITGALSGRNIGILRTNCEGIVRRQ